MNDAVCRVVCASPECVLDEEMRPGLLIAADGGWMPLLRRGIVPDLIVGDFDSSERPSLPDVPVVAHPPEKDDTDAALAVNIGLERGCRDFILYGALGGRIDHEYANYQLLCGLARKGCRAVLRGADYDVHAVCGGRLELPAGFGTVSVFAAGGEARGVDLEGLKYPLTGGTLSPFIPLGVSNERTGVPASVSVRDGVLLVMVAGR